MADDWQPGDLALCVRRNPKGHDNTKEGGVYAVTGVVCNGLKVGLRLEGVEHHNLGSCTTRFKRIRPHTPDAEDAETIRLLTGAPVREPAA